MFEMTIHHLLHQRSSSPKSLARRTGATEILAMKGIIRPLILQRSDTGRDIRLPEQTTSGINTSPGIQSPDIRIRIPVFPILMSKSVFFWVSMFQLERIRLYYEKLVVLYLRFRCVYLCIS